MVGVDDSDAADAAIPVIESWQRTFGGGVVRVVEVAPLAVGVGATLEELPDSASALRVEPDRAHHFARRLADRGVAATWEILYGADPAAQLDDLAADLEQRRGGGHQHRLDRPGDPLAQHDPQARTARDPTGARRPRRIHGGDSMTSSHRLDTVSSRREQAAMAAQWWLGWNP